jgi:ADP-ribose pyrophosphatase YjhB (NUDIX family)
MKQPKIASGGLFISSLTRRALFCIRSPHKTHRLTWTLWGGMLRPNETPESGLYREVKEEMGFMPSIIQTHHFNEYRSSNKEFIYHTFVCVVEKEFAPWISSENCGYCWMDLGIWPKPMHYGAKKTLCTDASIEKLTMILDNFNY